MNESRVRTSASKPSWWIRFDAIRLFGLILLHQLHDRDINSWHLTHGICLREAKEQSRDSEKRQGPP